MMIVVQVFSQCGFLGLYFMVQSKAVSKILPSPMYLLAPMTSSSPPGPPSNVMTAEVSASNQPEIPPFGTIGVMTRARTSLLGGNPPPPSVFPTVLALETVLALQVEQPPPQDPPVIDAPPLPGESSSVHMDPPPP